MPNTYDPISSTTLQSNSSTITLSSIPSTYTDLVLNIVTSVSGGDINLQFNADTANNYSRTFIFSGPSSSAFGTGRSTTVNGIALGAPGTLRAITVQIQSYANTNINKTVLWSVGSATDDLALAVGMWRSTAAITSLSLGNTTYLTGTTVNLYGIKAA